MMSLQILALGFLVIDLLDLSPAALACVNSHLRDGAQDGDDVIKHISKFFYFTRREL